MKKCGTVIVILLSLLLFTCVKAERHTVQFSGRFASQNGMSYVGFRQDVHATVQPLVYDTQGKEWNLQDFMSLKGFRVLGASMRFYADDVSGKNRHLVWRALNEEMNSFPMRSSGVNTVISGWNLFDVTDLFREWLMEGEPFHGFSLSCVGGKKGHLATMRPDIIFMLGFETDEQLPLFRGERIRETEMLDSAFSLIEEDNIFLKTYDDTAGSLTQSLYPLGVPYYFGGHNEEKILQVFYPLQESHYFKPYRKYLCGFDCAGYTKWCMRQEGLEEHPDLDTILRQGSDSFCLDVQHPETWQFYLQPGDMIVTTHGYDHIMIYLGTMRMMGFTEENAGEAEPYMDYPLVIHCGSNPFYYERYAQYLKEKGQLDITSTDGGVTVSIVMKDLSMATHSKTAVWGSEYGYFDVGGTPLLVFPLHDCTDFSWFAAKR